MPLANQLNRISIESNDGIQMRMADTCALDVRTIAGSADVEVHAVHHSTIPIDRATLERLVERLRQQHGGQLLRAMVFGDLVDPPPPDDDRWIWVRPVWPHDLVGASVELLGVAPLPGHDTSVRRTGPGTTVVTHATPAGTLTRRLVHCVPRPTGIGTYAQVTDALKEAETALAEAGMAPTDIDRTWFFLSDIDRTYPALNAARDEAFDRWALRRYPVSTGIGAALPDGVAVSVVLEASATEGADSAEAKQLAVLSTPLQTAPSDYGPRFVRGNQVRICGRHTVNVSGISSIDPRGVSITSADPAVCVDYTMRSMLDVLRAGGLGVADISSAYVYCTSPAVRAAFATYQANHRLDFPYLLTHVPVCRPELVFEIEARAVRAQPVTPRRSR
jgi:enamine deaminase RidA (YjgF/YER057c/UK114 family)